MTARNKDIYEAWEALFKKYGEAYPKEKAEIDRMFSGVFDGKVEDALREMAKSATGPAATRALSGKALNAIKDYMPELVGAQSPNAMGLDVSQGIPSESNIRDMALLSDWCVHIAGAYRLAGART